MKAWILRTIIVAMFGLVIASLIFQKFVSSASKDWVRLGGGIAWNEHFILGARRISLGTIPGNTVSSDLIRVRDSLHRINRLPLCREIVINSGQLDLDAAEITFLLDDTTFEHIYLVDFNDDPPLLHNAISTSSCRQVTFQGRELPIPALKELKTKVSNVSVMAYDKHLNPYFHER